MTEDFAGQTAIITGGASGIGAAVAEAFVHEGARVLLLDIDNAKLTMTQERLLEQYSGSEVTAVCLDVSDTECVSTVVAEYAATGDGVNYLANVAASFIAAGASASKTEWTQVLDVNVSATALITAKVSQFMPPGSAVVNISSISAHVAQANRWTYNATKAAIIALTRGQALDLAKYQIRVNAVSPGWIWTAEVARAANGDRAKWEPIWGKYHMLERLGEPSEVADAVLFLCSSKASFITGTELMVDGGYSAMGPEGLGETAKFAGSTIPAETSGELE